MRRDAPASNFLQDLEKRAADIQKTFSEQFQAISNSKNVQDVNKAVKESSDVVLKQLSTLSSSLQSAVSLHISFVYFWSIYKISQDLCIFVVEFSSHYNVHVPVDRRKRQG